LGLWFVKTEIRDLKWVEIMGALIIDEAQDRVVSEHASGIPLSMQFGPYLNNEIISTK